MTTEGAAPTTPGLCVCAFSSTHHTLHDPRCPANKGAAPSGEKHRERAREVAESIAWDLWAAGSEARTLCSECDALWTAHDECHVPTATEDMFNVVVRALARVEAETRRQTLTEVHEALSGPVYAAARMKLEVSLRVPSERSEAPRG